MLKMRFPVMGDLTKFQPSQQEKPLSKPPRKNRTKARKKEKRLQKRHRSVPFRQTPLGNFLATQCPVEYELLYESAVLTGRIDINVIEAFSYTSDNPAFRTTAFRKALVDFRRHGCRTDNAVKFDVDDEVRKIKEKLGI